MLVGLRMLLRLIAIVPLLAKTPVDPAHNGHDKQPCDKSKNCHGCTSLGQPRPDDPPTHPHNKRADDPESKRRQALTAPAFGLYLGYLFRSEQWWLREQLESAGWW